MRNLLILLGVLASSPAAAQDWFLHEYGDLRAYFGDWMAVCTEAGNGRCYVVQTGTDPGSGAVFDMRLAAHRIDGSPDWAIEVMDRNLPAAELSALAFSFDGEEVTIPPGSWTPGDLTGPGASDMVTIRAPDVAADLVARMRPANRVTVTYLPQGAGDGRASFPLRGVTAAMQAVQARVLARQE